MNEHAKTAPAEPCDCSTCRYARAELHATIAGLRDRIGALTRANADLETRLHEPPRAKARVRIEAPGIACDIGDPRSVAIELGA